MALQKCLLVGLKVVEDGSVSCRIKDSLSTAGMGDWCQRERSAALGSLSSKVAQIHPHLVLALGHIVDASWQVAVEAKAPLKVLQQ
jgi:hypothetical protein